MICKQCRCERNYLNDDGICNVCNNIDKRTTVIPKQTFGNKQGVEVKSKNGNVRLENAYLQ